MHEQFNTSLFKTDSAKIKDVKQTIVQFGKNFINLKPP